MPGPVPGIHVFCHSRGGKDVDGRAKPGHDEESHLTFRILNEARLLMVGTALARLCPTLRHYGTGYAANSSASTKVSRVRVTSGQSRLKSATRRFISSPFMARSSEASSANSYVA